MAMMFGRFEIQSELSKSDTALIYKALDTKTNQVVALKTQSLVPLGERSSAFVETLIAEGESTRDLVSQNIVALYGAGEIGDQFCAAMEYIQGNSVATMMARHEGFSIWDLLDITRQVCAGLEKAAAKGVTHCSLEPAKLMVQWDGMVKILGYGISNMSLIEAECGKGLGSLMGYCSPEQIRGEAIDLRSNLFTLGAILYEMAASRKAFDAADPVALVNQVENAMPPSPSVVNVKIHPALSELIMKALAKDPADRYQNARELIDDLEKCKENGKKAAPEAKKAVAASGVAGSTARSAAASKFVSPSNMAKPAAASPSLPPKSVSRTPTVAAPAASAAPAPARPNVAGGSGSGFGAAAASGMTGSAALDLLKFNDPIGNNSSASPTTSGARLITDFERSALDPPVARTPVMSAAPGAARDPMMTEPGTGSAGKSFSDLAEMPPLQDSLFAPSVPEQAGSQDPLEQVSPEQPSEMHPREEEKPRFQPQEIARKAAQQIATLPPRLMLFSLLGAVGLILMIAIAVFFRVRSDDDGATAAPQKATERASVPTPAPISKQPVPHASAPAQIARPVAPTAQTQPRPAAQLAQKHGPKNGRSVPTATPTPVVMAGEALIDSTPQGASFQVDGKGDPSWVTPFTVTGLSPGKHIISVSKAGYSSDIHAVDVIAGSRASLALHLAPVNALVVVNSTPAGAEIVMDGKPSGRVTPAQFSVEKGSHTVLLRKHGYLDETTTAELGPAQNFQYSPVLRALGNTEDMKMIGGLNRLFGRGGESVAGMGSIAVRTQPKGATVAINQQVLEKTAPLSVAVGPGNYIVDITLTGFKPIHKVITVEKGNRAAIDEILERQ